MLRKITVILMAGCTGACGGLGQLEPPRTIGEIKVAYHYIPVDPLAVDVRFVPEIEEKSVGAERERGRYYRCVSLRDDPKKVDVMDALPDHTVRMAIRQTSATATGSFTPVAIGASGKSYEVIIDSVNVDTVNVPFAMRATNGEGTILPIMTLRDPLPAGVSFDVRRLSDPSKAPAGFENVNLPIYVGVGLRLTANVRVRRGNVGLTLPALAAAVQAEQARGDLTMQTLGVYNQQVSALYSVPTDLNAGTIQQAVVALGSVKNILYDWDTGTRPRVTGIRNPLQTSDPLLMNMVYSELARSPVDWVPCGTA